MNKLFNKIAALSVGLAMAIGVGVAVGSQRNDARSVKADSATISYTAGTTASMTGSNDAATLGLNASNWSVVADKGGNGNYPGLNKDGSIRMYGSTSNANKITVSSLNGATISSIVISFVNNYGNGIVKVNGNAVSASGGSYSINASSFEIHHHQSSTTQVRFTSIAMTYSSGDANKLGAPSPVFNRASNTITWTAIEHATSYELKVDSGSYTTATSGYSVASVSLNDAHTVSVRALASGYTTSDDGTVTFHRYATKGTSDNPYTVEDARRAIDDNDGLTNVYATGVVSAIPTAYNSQNGNITFNFIDEGGTDFLQAYKCTGTDAANVQVGDTVVVSGNLKKYNSTYEFDAGCVLESLTHPVVETTYTVSFDSDGGEDPDDKEVGEGLTFIFPSAGTNSGYLFAGWTCDAGTTFFQAGETSPAVNDDVEYTAFWQTKGLQTNPYTIAEAKTAIDNNKGLVDACVSGKISQVDSYNSTYHSITYWISDDGTTTSQLQAYSGKGLNSADFSAKEDVEVGADVVICGTLKKYNTTYEFDKNNYQLSYTAPAATPTISVSPATLTLKDGGATGTITATTTNDGGATVVWSTSDATVATVSGGTVTPEGEGTCTITAKITVSGTDYAATCAVTVGPAEVTIDVTGVYTKVTNLNQLVANAAVIITNEDGDIAMSTNQASNNRTGISSGLSNGEITISSASSTIQVFRLEDYSSGGDKIVAFYAYNGTSNGYIYAASSGSNHLKTESAVSDDSKFTIGLSEGSFSVVAESSSNRNVMRYNPNNGSPIFACYQSTSTAGTVPSLYIKTSSADPTVVTSVTLNKASDSVYVGSTTTLTATILPATAQPQTATWLTSDATIATVANGVVTGVAVGTATITAFADVNSNGTLDSGEKSATCTVTVSAASSGGSYQKVTATSGITSGTYLVVYEVGAGEGYALDGRLYADQTSNGVDVEIENDEIESNATTDAIAFTFDSTDGTFLGGSGYYFYHTGSKNTLDYTDDSESAGNTVTIADDKADIQCGDYYLRFNATSGQNRFRYYTSNTSQQDVQLYKYVESVSYTAADFATEFLTTLSTGSSHVCVADGSTNLSSLKAAWKALAGKWGDVSDPTSITNAVASESGNNYQKTKALYIYIAEKYNTQLQDSELTDYNFMGLTGLNPRSSARVSIFDTNTESSGPTLAIIIASILSLTVVGGYFVIRKRKFTK